MVSELITQPLRSAWVSTKDNVTIVYKATEKALKKNVFKPDDRFVFLSGTGAGSIALWNGNKLVQSDVMYRKPDSHCTPTDELLPKSLVASKNEIQHIKDHNIALPFGVTDACTATKEVK
jgi:hypothetical protein